MTAPVLRMRQIVQISPDLMSGTPVFKGTQVPVQAVIDHLEAGDGLNVFLQDFPSVTRQQAIDFLELARATDPEMTDARAY